MQTYLKVRRKGFSGSHDNVGIRRVLRAGWINDRPLDTQNHYQEVSSISSASKCIPLQLDTI